MRAMRKFQRGLSLVTAVFLLVVMSSLAAVMMTFFTAQQQSSVLDMMGTRAYQAARAGVEWGAYQVLQAGGSCTGNLNLPAGTSLSGFAVSVTCTTNGPYTDPGAASGVVSVYNLTSTATQGRVRPTGLFRAASERNPCEIIIETGWADKILPVLRDSKPLQEF